MRSIFLTAQERQMKARIRFRLSVIVLLLLIIIIAVIACIRIDKVCRMQTDMLNQMMEHRMFTEDEEEYVLDEEEIEGQAIEQTLSDADREYITRIVMAEARSGGIESMMAVAQTIKDRGDLWNMPYIDVVTAEAQYTSPYNGEISTEAIQAIWAVFDADMRAFEEPVTHFHSESIEAPYWTANKVCRGSVGGNRFWY